MTMLNNLSPMFHGTGANYLKEGDVIEPKSGAAFATVDRNIADKQAAVGHKKMEQGTLFGSVYRVEPLNPADVISHEIHTKQRISPSGFVVKEHMGFVPSDFSERKI